MPHPVFVDSWGWVALGHRRDSRHLEIKERFQRLRASQGRIYTTDYVLDEVITILFKRDLFEEGARYIEGILESAGQGNLVIERITSARFAEA